MRYLMVATMVGCGTVHGLDEQGSPEEIEAPTPDQLTTVDGSSIEIAPAPGEHDWDADLDVAWIVDHTEGGVWCEVVPLAETGCAEVSEPFELALGGEGSSIGTFYPCMCAEISCTDKGDGSEVARWTWDLGHVCP